MPNAYFFTKRMAEVLVSSRHSAAFPVAIVRPSLVGCTARSPHPGYFGNNAGPTAVALAFALGIATFTSHQVPLNLLSTLSLKHACLESSLAHALLSMRTLCNECTMGKCGNSLTVLCCRRILCSM